jgi:hypothetical protein
MRDHRANSCNIRARRLFDNAVIEFLTTMYCAFLFIECWWGKNKDKYRHINQLVINLDNGPHNSGHHIADLPSFIFGG